VFGSAYQHWQAALESEFFGPNAGGRTVLFHVDDGAAELIAEKYSLDVSLVEAVRSELRLDGNLPPYGKVAFGARQHNRLPVPQATAPPTLPLLAVTVLAASRMVSDENFRSNAYYPRLAEVLTGRHDHDAEQIVHRDFSDVAEMWRQLDRWLDTWDGARGTSTIIDHHRLVLIGYPLSQCLLRGYDRELIERMFSLVGYAPRSAADRMELLDATRKWAAHGRGFSHPLERAIADPRQHGLVGGLLQRLLAEWDGSVRERTGRRVGRLRLAADVDAGCLYWLAETPDEAAGGAVVDPRGGVYTFHASNYGPYAEWGREPRCDGSEIRSGLRLEGEVRQPPIVV